MQDIKLNYTFYSSTSTKLKAYADARAQEISQGGESTPSASQQMTLAFVMHLTVNAMPWLID